MGRGGLGRLLQVGLEDVIRCRLGFGRHFVGGGEGRKWGSVGDKYADGGVILALGLRGRRGLESSCAGGEWVVRLLESW